MSAHALNTFPSSVPSRRRLASIAFVAALHVVLIYALINMGVIKIDLPRIKQDITLVPVSIERPKPPQPPRTRPPALPQEQVWVPEPPIDIADNNGPGQTIGGTTNVPPARAETGARGIMNTHTRPPYPPISVRLSEEGMVTLTISISETGAVTDAVLVKSSGYPRLDEAALAWVKTHWRYRPAIAGGRPVASTATAQVKFELKDLRGR